MKNFQKQLQDPYWSFFPLSPAFLSTGIAFWLNSDRCLLPQRTHTKGSSGTSFGSAWSSTQLFLPRWSWYWEDNRPQLRQKCPPKSDSRSVCLPPIWRTSRRHSRFTNMELLCVAHIWKWRPCSCTWEVVLRWNSSTHLSQSRCKVWCRYWSPSWAPLKDSV